MSKEKQIEFIDYEQDRLMFFVNELSLAQRKYDRLFKTFKDAPYMSEGAVFLSDAGREVQFYKDVVEMLDKGHRKQSEGKWTKHLDEWDCEYAKCSCCEAEFYDSNGDDTITIDMFYKFCPECGSKMKGGAE